MRSVMRQFPFVQKSVEELKYDLFPIFDYDYSRDGTDKSSLGTETLFRIKPWSKVYISCSQINHRFLLFNSSWSSTVSRILPRHTIQLLQSHLPRDHETLISHSHFITCILWSRLYPHSFCLMFTSHWSFFLLCGARSQSHYKLLTPVPAHLKTCIVNLLSSL